MEKEIKELMEKYESKINQLTLENDALLKELDLLNLKVNLIGYMYRILKVKSELEGNKIPSEVEMFLNDFFRLTTFRTTVEVKNGKRRN